MKLLYDPKPYIVIGIKGAQITCRRGGKEKRRSKEKIKVVREATTPQHTRYLNKYN